MICIHNKYFVIYRGDDTDFPGNQELVIELKTDRDLSGCKAHFSFQGYKIDFDEIPEDKRLSIVFPSKETKNFSIGHSFASLRITHGEGDNLKVLTLSNSIDILVTNNVHEAYHGNCKQAITVNIATAFTKDQLAALNSGIDADKVTKIAQNEIDILAEIYRATHEEARLQGAINEIKTFEAVVADSLPDPSEQYRKKLYLIPSTNPETRNVKDEFICIEHDGVWSWEQIGSTSIDLTDYVKKPTADAPTVVLDSVNGCLLEVGTRNDDSGGVLIVGNHIGGIIEVGSNEGSLASIKKNGNEVATENQLPYSRNTTTTLKDRAFNALTLDGTEYNLTAALAAVTPTVEGSPRDLLIVATATAATTISFTAETIKGDKPIIDGEGKWLITLTEYEPDTWYCRQIKMEDAQ